MSDGKDLYMLPHANIDDAPVPIYFLMMLSGLMFALIVTLIKHKAFGLRRRDILRIIAFMGIGSLIGARVFKVVVQAIQHGGEPGFWTADNLLGIVQGAGVFYGGLLACMGTVALCAKLHRMDRQSAFNVLAYASLAFLSLSRIGCYCAGCCYGITLAGGTLFPVQLVEAGFCFAALLAFLIIRPERRWTGLPLFPVYLIIYPAGRFFIEFFRGDAERGVWLLSTSQWVGLALIALAIVWLKKRNPPSSGLGLAPEAGGENPANIVSAFIV